MHIPRGSTRNTWCLEKDIKVFIIKKKRKRKKKKKKIKTLSTYPLVFVGFSGMYVRIENQYLGLLK